MRDHFKFQVIIYGRFSAFTRGCADVNAIYDKGETPLHVALVGDKAVMELLRQHGGHN